MSRTQSVSFSSGHDVLSGTLHLPDGQGPYPALAMLQGSGPTDRDNNGYFPAIRDHFVAHGLAVLSWDKPGIGESTGHWTEQTFFDRASEALAGVAWLRERPEIDPTKIGLWGHSQGGWIGPIAAAQSSDLAFLITNSGPGVDAHEQDLYGVEHTFRERGGSDDEVRAAIAFMQSLHDAANAGLPYERVQAELLEPARGTPGYAYFGDVDPGLWNFLVINSQRVSDPVAALEQVNCLILAIFGERDSAVPVEKSVRIFKKVGASSENRGVTIKVYPNADHRIGVNAPGTPFTFAPGYLAFMTDWIWRTLRLIT